MGTGLPDAEAILTDDADTPLAFSSNDTVAGFVSDVGLTTVAIGPTVSTTQ